MTLEFMTLFSGMTKLTQVNEKFVKKSHRLKKILRDAFVQMQMYCDIANHKVNLKQCFMP